MKFSQKMVKILVVYRFKYKKYIFTFLLQLIPTILCCVVASAASFTSKSQ